MLISITNLLILSTMKTKIPASFKSAIVLALLITGCSKDNVNPDYVGEWIFESDSIKSVLILKSDNLESQSYALLNDNSYYLYAASFADMKVDGDTFDIYYTKMQIDISFVKNHVPSGELTNYTKEMYENTKEIDSLWHIKYRYELTGGNLTLYSGTMSWVYSKKQ